MKDQEMLEKKATRGKQEASWLPRILMQMALVAWDPMAPTRRKKTLTSKVGVGVC